LTSAETMSDVVLNSPLGCRSFGRFPQRVMMPAHGWIFSCLSSIPMNCSIRRARVSAFFAV
jgi:hypothetical protein